MIIKFIGNYHSSLFIIVGFDWSLGRGIGQTPHIMVDSKGVWNGLKHKTQNNKGGGPWGVSLS